MIKYTKEHEWVKVEGNQAAIGITEYAAEALGELVYVELPAVGSEIKKGDAFAVVESSKSASDVYAPFNGKVISVNESLTNNPNIINTSKTGEVEIASFEIDNSSFLDNCMNEEEYKTYLTSLH